MKIALIPPILHAMMGVAYQGESTRYAIRGIHVRDTDDDGLIRRELCATDGRRILTASWWLSPGEEPYFIEASRVIPGEAIVRLGDPLSITAEPDEICDECGEALSRELPNPYVLAVDEESDLGSWSLTLDVVASSFVPEGKFPDIDGVRPRREDRQDAKHVVACFDPALMSSLLNAIQESARACTDGLDFYGCDIRIANHDEAFLIERYVHSKQFPGLLLTGVIMPVKRALDDKGRTFLDVLADARRKHTAGTEASS